VPNSASPRRPKGILLRKICRSAPVGLVIVLSATCEFVGLTSSANSTSSNFVLPTTRCCSSTGKVSQRVRSCRNLLHDHIAAASEVRILVADDCGAYRCNAGGILRSIDEPHQVTLVEVLKPVNFVDDVRVASEPVRQQSGEFETDIEATRPQMKQQVSGRRDRGVPGTMQFDERMEATRPRPDEESIPQRRTHSHDTSQV